MRIDARSSEGFTWPTKLEAALSLGFIKESFAAIQTRLPDIMGPQQRFYVAIRFNLEGIRSIDEQTDLYDCVL